MSPLVRIWQVGRVNYVKALQYQKILGQPHDGHQFENTLLILEHNPTYTVGIRSKDYSHEEEVHLKSLGADFHRTDRGGLITFHGPGQLVVYPILHLRQFHEKQGTIGLRRYVEKLQAVVAKTCQSMGLQGCKTIKEFPGLWVGPKGEERKVCAVGVRAGRNIVSHGIALNCNVDLSWFEHIVPCGLEGKGVTSLTKELDRYVPVGDVIPAFIIAFSEEFLCQFCEFPVSLINKLSKEES
ncbi:putative lipoyltransferase 2, mitochondrial [Hetaerina americana]|uniref:putative lipoyltransferase 2, mitochondrial n=1 Tax=Hetaerina americana TaxID=62018 RepID=UPI003A7F18EB